MFIYSDDNVVVKSLTSLITFVTLSVKAVFKDSKSYILVSDYKPLLFISTILLSFNVY